MAALKDDKLAGVVVFAQRVAARLIDLVIAAFYMFMLVTIAYSIGLTDTREMDRASSIMLLSFIIGLGSAGLAFPLLYEFLCLLFWQGTIGKLALCLSVMRRNNLPPRWWQYAIRTLIFWISVLGPVVGIFYALLLPEEAAIWRQTTLALAALYAAIDLSLAAYKGRAFHDWISGTRVVPAVLAEDGARTTP